ncbi:MAG: class I SAM-dependent methyltransferase [Elusimicrobia bacterium]|nr:class I SAM-dependent methyltransferase [Elusimicrobiota bacterium]
MMQNLAEIYDAAFFSEWGRSNEPYMRTAEVLTETLVREFEPKRVADIGCGCGVYAHEFARHGVETFALDGVAPPPAHSFPVTVHVQDLTVPFANEWGRFDFALCLEVAEHIPEELSDAFLDNLARFSDVIVMSAAPPNQGGHHHVNERPKRYWVDRLAKKGFAYDRPCTGRVFEAVRDVRPPFMWMAQHLSVYKRVTDPDVLGRMLPFSVRMGG